jgi:hypothetical protein
MFSGEYGGRLAQLAQNSGWYTSQVANTGLTKPLSAVFAPFPAKWLIPNEADSPPGSATKAFVHAKDFLSSAPASLSFCNSQAC